jgi:hypothetical protein
MGQVIVLTVAAALVGILAKRGRDNAMHSKLQTQDTSSKFELATEKVKRAAKKVEQSAGSVELALKPLLLGALDERRVGNRRYAL